MMGNLIDYMNCCIVEFLKMFAIINFSVFVFFLINNSWVSMVHGYCF